MQRQDGNRGQGAGLSSSVAAPHLAGMTGCVYGSRLLLVLEVGAGGSVKAALTAVSHERSQLLVCARTLVCSVCWVLRHSSCLGSETLPILRIGWPW